MPLIEIRNFEENDAELFRNLNEAWISKYFVMEAADYAALGDPKGHILELGGHVYMAFVDGAAVGTCALIAHGPGTFEVAKMSVADAYQGMGIGRKLLEHSVAQARHLGAKLLILETNRKLTPAVRLYESTGFQHLPADRDTHSPYERANVFMEMAL
jgi:putative acetyltransferase